MQWLSAIQNLNEKLWGIKEPVHSTNSLRFTPSPSKKQLFWILFIAVLGIGLFARFVDLSRHFTNTDDLGIIEVTFEAQKAGNLFHLPTILTNAPLQYIPTYFLLSEKMHYEQLLFWARLPSCLLGFGALLILLLFYLEFARGNESKTFLALTLAACSWEAIVFSKQAHSYSIGVFAAALLCLVFIIQTRHQSSRKLSPLELGIVLAFIGSMQYQILIFFPAFFISLFFYHRRHASSILELIKKFALSAFIFGILFFPIWKFFLRTKSGNFYETLNWTLGRNQEFAFPSLASENIFSGIVKISWFYLKNFYFIFESKIAFIPASSFLFHGIMVGLFLLFCLGIIHFLTTTHRKTRSLGLFCGLVLLTWWILVPLKHFPYTPSRHTLILLPLLCITIAEGMDYFRTLLKKIFSQKKSAIISYTNIVMGVSILALFLFYYPHFLNERKNPIREEEVCGLIQKFKVDSMLFDRRSLHMEYMPCVEALAEKQDQPGEVRTFATISKYPGVSAQERCGIFKQINNVAALDQLRATGTLPMVMKQNCPDFKTVYQQEVDKGVMEGFNPNLDADIYGNRLFFYILSLDPPPSDQTTSH